MYKINSVTIVMLMLVSTLVSSCAAVAGIFNAGMSVGIFMVVLIIVVIGVLVMRSNRNRNN